MARKPLRELSKLDRPREKLLLKGPEALSDLELIAVMLGKGLPNYDVLSVAASIVRRFPGRSVLDADVESLKAVPGVGKVKAAQLMAMCEYARRLFEVNDEVHVLDSIDAVLSEIKDLRKLRQEHFVVLAVSARRHLLHRQTVAMGATNIQVIDPREVFFPAIQSNAVGIILAHNHPSDDPSPSQSDLDLTNRLVAAGEMMGVHILDHVIVAQTGHYSFQEAGQI